MSIVGILIVKVCGSECRVEVLVVSCNVSVHRYAYEHIDEWTRV